jgi:hypothetical protein
MGKKKSAPKMSRKKVKAPWGYTLDGRPKKKPGRKLTK